MHCYTTNVLFEHPEVKSTMYICPTLNMRKCMSDIFLQYRHNSVKMLGLYRDTLLIGHRFCSMLSILNELTLQTELQNVMTNNMFWTKK